MLWISNSQSVFGRKILEQPPQQQPPQQRSSSYIGQPPTQLSLFRTQQQRPLQQFSSATGHLSLRQSQFPSGQYPQHHSPLSGPSDSEQQQSLPQQSSSATEQSLSPEPSHFLELFPRLYSSEELSAQFSGGQPQHSEAQPPERQPLQRQIPAQGFPTNTRQPTAADWRPYPIVELQSPSPQPEIPADPSDQHSSQCFKQWGLPPEEVFSSSECPRELWDTEIKAELAAALHKLATSCSDLVEARRRTREARDRRLQNQRLFSPETSHFRNPEIQVSDILAAASSTKDTTEETTEDTIVGVTTDNTKDQNKDKKDNPEVNN
ncbi:MAG: hypothetical protein Q9165_004370 [Trypethelium subeluteriae]